jgi:aminoglycoside/choline kinase family phosphotransferase
MRGTNEPSLPVAIDDIDPAWLTSALRSSTLDAGCDVERFSVETIGVGVGLMGLLYRLTVEYRGDDADAPSTVIVKLPVLLDATRQVAAAYRFYEKEVAFYRSLAPQSALRSPHIYLAAHDPDTDNFVLVMEDIGHLRAADQVAGCAPSDAAAAMVALARHHASFWNDPRFVGDELAWLPFGSDAPTPEGVQQCFANYWGPFVDFMGDELMREIRVLGEWVPGTARELLQVPEGHPITLVHGDYRLDNLFFDEQCEVTAVDWQITMKGVGGYDFGYFVSQSLTVDNQREYVDALAQTYLETLCGAGIIYPEEQFWLDVRRTVLFCLTYPVQCMALDLTDPRAAALVRALAQRASNAIIEMGALDLVAG